MTAEAPLLSVVVVTYNSRDDIEACLDGVLGQLPDDGSHVVVLDNASSDGTADLVTALVDDRGLDVRLIRSDENLGFARACNRAAGLSDSEFVLLLNPDTAMRGGCIDALIDLARRKPRGGLYGGRTFSSSGEVDPKSCWGRMTLWSLTCFAFGLSALFADSQRFNPEGMGAWRRDDERHVDVVTGCLLLARRDVWDRLGGFDERFFMYGEDADLSHRAAELGYRPIITPHAELVHVVGASSAAVHKEILLFRGKVTLIDKLWSGARRSLARTLLLGGVALRAYAASAGRGVLRATRNADHQTSPATWSQLWRRRAEWVDGWPPTT